MDIFRCGGLSAVEAYAVQAFGASRSIKNPDAPFLRFLGPLNIEFLVALSTKAHKEVLQSQCYSFVKPAFWTRLVGEIAGLGLLFAEGEEHKKQRRLLASPFQFSNIKNLLPIFNAKGSELTSMFAKQIAEDSQKLIKESAPMSNIALDIVGLAAVDYHLNSLSSGSVFSESYAKVFEQSPTGQAITAINKFIPSDGFEKAKNRELFTLMIEKKSFGLDPWTEDEILNHLLNFMSAGHETTAISVALALHTLGSYPHMQKRLRDEIKAHITYYTSPEISGKGSAMSQVDIGTANNEIGSMKFLDNFVKESLRVHSHVPCQAAKDLWIESVQILKGTTVIIMPQLAAYNKTIWGPTADEGAKSSCVSGVYITGPRICIDKSFATLEFKALLIEMVRNFEFETTAPLRFQKGITMRPVGGIKLRVRKVEG
ncbi:cytochrome P450 [Lepidopterella palustris CBS 459.81]|uniref:Cytochrome P450 n=1 Tax=Lepidopterella palustris CBS 459.81 TaxID=1314670 RepID=A0A8E2JHN6_9PEZI|nr:cytochrome P450 [Lepidopterella palustris CBS 459.81]